MTGVKLKEQYISYLPLLQTLNNISVIMLLRTFNIISLILDMRKDDYVIQQVHKQWVMQYVVANFEYVGVCLCENHSSVQCLFVGESLFQVQRANVVLHIGYILTLSLLGLDRYVRGSQRP